MNRPENLADILQPPRLPDRRIFAARAARQDRLRIRILPDELVLWRAAAQASGAKSLSGWLRAVADEAALGGRDPAGWRRDLALLVRTLRSGVSNDLNQLLRHLNAAAKASRPEDMASHTVALAEISTELARIAGMAEKVLAPRRRKRK